MAKAKRNAAIAIAVLIVVLVGAACIINLRGHSGADIYDDPARIAAQSASTGHTSLRVSSPDGTPYTSAYDFKGFGGRDTLAEFSLDAPAPVDIEASLSISRGRAKIVLCRLDDENIETVQEGTGEARECYDLEAGTWYLFLIGDHASGTASAEIGPRGVVNPRDLDL